MIIHDLTWADFRKRLDGTLAMMAFREQSTTRAYALAADDGPVTYECTIFKADQCPPGGNQAQHDADRAAYEASFRGAANKGRASAVQLDERDLSGGSFRYLLCDLLAGHDAGNPKLTEQDWTFPVPVDVLSGAYYADTAEVGDEVGFQVRPGVVGTLRENEAAGQTVLSVTATVAAAARPGTWVSLGAERGVGLADAVEYLVTAADQTPGAETVTVAPALAAAHTAGQYVYLVVKMLCGYNASGFRDRGRVVPNVTHRFGLEKTGSSGIKPSYRVRVSYLNKSTTVDKTIIFHLGTLM